MRSLKRPATLTLATLPLVVTLAACSLGGGPSASAGSPTQTPTTSADATRTTSPSGPSTVDATSSAPSSPSSPRSPSSPARPTSRPVAHRATPADAVATVTAYMVREVWMRHPVASPFRSTGPDSGEVTVRPRLSTGALGPTTAVAVQRAGSGWWVSGATAGDIVVDRARLATTQHGPVRVWGRILDHGAWRVTVKADRSGPDMWLGSAALSRDPLLGAPFDAVVPVPRTSGSGSVIFWEGAGAGGGALRATVVRVRLGAAPSGLDACSQELLLPMVKSWLDDPAHELVITRLDMQGCRNGYALLYPVPRRNPAGHPGFDAPALFVRQAPDGAWRVIGLGTGIGCPSRDYVEACSALGLRTTH